MVYVPAHQQGSNVLDGHGIHEDYADSGTNSAQLPGGAAMGSAAPVGQYTAGDPHGNWVGVVELPTQ